MSSYAGSAGPSNGLIFSIDMSNTQKSWKGAPVTNLLPTPTINSIPTTGNSWGTYNTNQYNSNTYFSIGTISSVASNIVTTSAAHPLRSYDVVTPQTTGGGLTAGTNYLVKKLSSTTFSLHSYNSSQDGSQGYINPATGTHAVYDNFANDVRISINSTSFPTMWWGPPHLPNSGLVKEVRTNGCSIPGIPTTDCLRLYHTRPDGVTDGMAYSVDATVTANTAHTVSFWTKTVNAAAVGQYISYQIYNYGVISPAGYSFNATLGPVGVWTKQSMTFTPVNPYCISYFFPSSGNIVYDLAHIQFESGSVANYWTSSSRSSTQALVDLTGRNTLTASNLTFNSDGTFGFNGSSSVISAPNNTIFDTQTPSVEVWIKTNALSQNGFFFEKGTVNTEYSLFQEGSNIVWRQGSNSLYAVTASYITTSNWAHIVGTYTSGSRNLYINGVLVASDALVATVGTNSGGITIGSYNSGGYFYNGSIGVVKVYNRALSADEIKQNFNALRNRYGV